MSPGGLLSTGTGATVFAGAVEVGAADEVPAAETGGDAGPEDEPDDPPHAATPPSAAAETTSRSRRRDARSEVLMRRVSDEVDESSMRADSQEDVRCAASSSAPRLRTGASGPL
jgi:hypothetical protein